MHMIHITKAIIICYTSAVSYGPLNGITWNIRRSVLTHPHRLSRFIIKLFEESFDRTYEAYLKNPNISQYSIIVDLQGYNAFEQGCPICK